MPLEVESSAPTAHRCASALVAAPPPHDETEDVGERTPRTPAHHHTIKSFDDFFERMRDSSGHDREYYESFFLVGSPDNSRRASAEEGMGMAPTMG
mmetsp:Transcript_31730/g.74253  ORF Transcript_31730/g.74253 Transcript_31730/m.74253 type:complete len:96 (-) Transcript_31730:168-455(-)